MLFDPLKKSFDLPTLSVGLGDYLWRQVKAIGQKANLFFLRVEDSYPSQRVFHLISSRPHQDYLVRPKGGVIRFNLFGLDNPKGYLGSRPGDEVDILLT